MLIKVKSYTRFKHSNNRRHRWTNINNYSRQKWISIYGTIIAGITIIYFRPHIEPLSNAKQSINRKINPSLCKEWSLFYQNKTSGCISKLNTLGHLLPDNESTSTIKTNIVNGSEGNDLTICDSSNFSRLTLLKDALESINELEEKLNLSDDVNVW